ncbi:MAG: tetratricopeptide repeat protein [Chloroflexota bacterium]
MDLAHFPLALKQRLPQELWQPVYLALRQDALLWSCLQITDLGERALELLPLQAQAWSPAALALFALQTESVASAPLDQDILHAEEGDPPTEGDTPPDLSIEELHRQPSQPVPTPWRERARQVLQNWQEQPTHPLTFQQAGWLALAWREGQRLKDTWQGVLPDFNSPPFSTALEDSAGISSALSCLVGFLPDPSELLRYLVCPEVGQASLAVHILLCQPLNVEAQSRLLRGLLPGQPLPVKLAVLQALSDQRPGLAAELARAVLAAPEVEAQAELQTNILSENLESITENLTSWQALAQVHQIAGQPEKSLHLLARSLRAVRRLQGHLSARLAQAATLARQVSAQADSDPAQDASLGAWRQAVQLAPNVPGYSVGLAMALAQAGRLDEAKACLEPQPAEPAGPAHPDAARVLASVRIAQLEQNLPLTYQAALQLLDLVEAGQLLELQDYVFLASLLLEAGLPPQAARAAQAGLRLFPAAANLLAVMARAQLSLQEPGLALGYILAALAAEANSSQDTAWQPPEALQRLLVECLEALGAWQQALPARLDLIAILPAPDASEYLALARCALQAGEPHQAISACTAAFKRFEENGALLEPSTLEQLGELASPLEQVQVIWAQAAIALGDWGEAQSHLQAALQLAQHRPELWLQLARACQRLNQPEQALAVLRTASQAVPHIASIHLALGEAYLQQQALTQALASLRRAASLTVSTPYAPRLACRLGQALYFLGHLQEALQVFEQVIPLSEHTSTSSSTLDEYARFLEPVDELEIESVYLYARTLLALDEYARAIPLLEELLQQRLQDPGPAVDLARCLLHEDTSGSAQESSRAITLLEQALDGSPVESPGLPVDPNWKFEARLMLARAYSLRAEYAPSLIYYHQALDHLSTNWTDERTRLVLELAQVALLAGQPEVAIAALEPLAQSGATPQVQRSLTQAYLASEMAEPAFRAARAALDLNPYDGEVLAWFIVQIDALQQMPDAAQLPLRSESLSALQAAAPVLLQQAAQASTPLDLLFSLGRMQLEDGERSAARQVFCSLADAREIDSRLPAGELYQVARSLRELGEASRAAHLLERLVEQNASPAGDARVDLLSELALAHHQAGEPQMALRVLEQAIGLAPERPALRLHMADLFDELGDAQSTQESLQALLRLEPTNAVVHQRLAWLLVSAGDLPAALAHAEQAVVHAGEECAQTASLVNAPPGELLHAARLLAAELAYALLMPKRAWEHIYADLACSQSPCQHLDHASLRLEMALEVGQQSLAGQEVALVQARQPNSVQALVGQVRLTLRKGDPAGARELFKSALALLTTAEAASLPASPAALADTLAGLRSAARAALELHDWQPALSLAHRWSEMAPSQPLAQLHLASVLVQCAEAQSLYRDLQVNANALGESFLAQEAREGFEAALRCADWVSVPAEMKPADVPVPGGLEEVVLSITHWHARGRAVFEPEARHAYDLGKFLRSWLPQPSDLAALLVALRKIGEQEAAIQAWRGNWIPALRRDALTHHPLVLVQVALAAAERPSTLAGGDSENDRQALQLAQQAIEHAEALPAETWPAPPLLDFLLARMAYRCRAWERAQSAIQQALAAWETEPAWHALAAQIYLAEGTSLPAQDEPLQETPPRQAQALAHLERAAVLQPEDAGYQLSLGCLYQDLGDLSQALRALSRSCHLAPDQAGAWLALARLQQQLGDLDQAAASAERAVECASPPAESANFPQDVPDDHNDTRFTDQISALLLRSEIALQANNPRGALSRAQAVLRVSPDHPQALQLLARAQQNLGQPEQALVALEKAIPFSDQPYLLQIQKIELLRQARGLEAAIPALRELSECYPEQPDLKVQLIHWLFEAAQPAAAIQAAQAVLQAAPEELADEQRAALHYRVGQYLLQDEQVDQAIPHLEQSIRYAPGFLDAYLELGSAYQGQRAHNRALQVFRQAIQAAPHDFRPYYQAGLALKESRDYMNAEEMLHQAARLAPDDVEVHRLLTAVVAMNLVYKLRPMKSEAQ